MALLNVLPPEHLTLEQFCALRHLAPEFGFVFLLDKLFQFLIETFLKWLAPKLLEIGIFRIENLKKLVLVRPDPIISALKLLVWSRAFR